MASISALLCSLEVPGWTILGWIDAGKGGFEDAGMEICEGGEEEEEGDDEDVGRGMGWRFDCEEEEIGYDERQSPHSGHLRELVNRIRHFGHLSSGEEGSSLEDIEKKKNKNLCNWKCKKLIFQINF